MSGILYGEGTEIMSGILYGEGTEIMSGILYGEGTEIMSGILSIVLTTFTDCLHIVAGFTYRIKFF
jgi:hypothetical protein